MTLFVCWIFFPLVMGILSLGCGLLVERIARTRLPCELLLPTGFAAIVSITLFATLSSATAPLALPAVLAVSVVGLAASLPPTFRRLDLWAAAAAIGVFAVFAAPVVLSGEATFAGYVKLDDTATFLALTDRALEHGRSLEGLAPSSYEATLAFNLSFYPLGSLLPLGIGAAIVGQDTAWVFQPYLAFLAALLGLSLYRLSGLVVMSRPGRAVAAFLASQAALLYGYSLWGGVKEVAAAALVALAAALTSEAFRAGRSGLALLPLGVAAAGLVGVLSVGALVWLVPAAGVVGLSLLRRHSGIRPVALIAAGAVLLIPSLVVARLMFGEGVLSSVRDQSELGNLVGALSPLQAFGIWPVADFRFRPERMDATYVLIALLAVSALAGILVAVARRAWELPLYVAGAVGGAVLYGLLASPWIEAKAFAIASPALLLTALVGALTLYSARRVEGAVLIGLIALGIGWSNVLAFGDATLAPRDQLAELEAIGEQFRAQGPALMTEYQPYGVRHFLRELDPEGASELRRSLIPLRDGSTVPKAGYADLAAFRPDAVLAYPDPRAAANAGGYPATPELSPRLAAPLLRGLATAGDDSGLRSRNEPVRPAADCDGDGPLGSQGRAVRNLDRWLRARNAGGVRRRTSGWTDPQPAQPRGAVQLARAGGAGSRRPQVGEPPPPVTAAARRGRRGVGPWAPCRHAGRPL